MCAPARAPTSSRQGAGGTSSDNRSCSGDALVRECCTPARGPFKILSRWHTTTTTTTMHQPLSRRPPAGCTIRLGILGTATPSDSSGGFYPFCDSCRKSQKCLTGPGWGRKSPPGPAPVSPLCCYYAPEHHRGQKLVQKDRMSVTHQEVVLGGLLHHPSYVAHRTHVVVVQHLVCQVIFL